MFAIAIKGTIGKNTVYTGLTGKLEANKNKAEQYSKKDEAEMAATVAAKKVGMAVEVVEI
jgi:hypothetical protein|tara:strand:+ start:1247 stop:1426 length:180 start_codon:yes stop_codon:yes gene_type:complete